MAQSSQRRAKTMHSRPIDLVLSKLPSATKDSNGWAACCPAHDDQTASLSIAEGSDGRALIHCKANCTTDAVLGKIGLKMADLYPKRTKEKPNKEREYIYQDEQGNPNRLVERLRYSDGSKSFPQYRPDPNNKGRWIKGVKGVRLLPYRLMELIAAPESQPVFIVEGEKDVDNLRKLGLVATCNSGGAGKWKAKHAVFLKNRIVYILPDNDPAGFSHAVSVAKSLEGIAKSVKFVVLPGLPPKGDVTNWLSDNHMKTPHDVIAKELLDIAEHCDGLLPQLPSDAGSVGGKATDDKSQSSQDFGERDPITGRLVLSADQTLPSAVAYVREFHSHVEARTLHCFAGKLVEWKNNCFTELEDEEMKNRLQPWLHGCQSKFSNPESEKGAPRFESNSRTINSALEAIRTYTYLPDTTANPSWLGDAPDGLSPRDIIACRSSLLHVPTRKKLRPTPRFFTTVSLDFDPNPAAPEPSEWHKFLSQVFEDDPEAIDSLWRWFGYVLSGSTNMQKMFMLIGPPRCGKRLISTVLKKLIGDRNCCGPTVFSLAEQFGLQELTGKSLAVVSDARFSGKELQTTIERLLCISGEDAISINRKFQKSHTVRLPVRFMFLTNEVPWLRDASGAIASRFIMIRMRKSFLGSEDWGLEEKLLAELPGIMNWALAGLDRLREQGRLSTPASAAEAIQDLKDSSSPVSQFVREECAIGEGYRIPVDELYDQWKTWCGKEGIAFTGKSTFGRDLSAAFPSIQRRRSTGLERFYDGIGGRYSMTQYCPKDGAF
jgi:putative DNA primase/helicase